MRQVLKRAKDIGRWREGVDRNWRGEEECGGGGVGGKMGRGRAKESDRGRGRAMVSARSATVSLHARVRGWAPWPEEIRTEGERGDHEGRACRGGGATMKEGRP